MKKIKKIISAILPLFPLTAFAQTSDIPDRFVSDVVVADSFPDFVSNMVGFLNNLFVLLIALSAAAILVSLLVSLKNIDNPDESSNARKVIVWGLLGIFVLVSIGGILNVSVGSISFQ